MMLPYVYLAVSLASLASASVCQGGIYAALAKDVAGWSVASSYCSTKYPLPVSTLVVTASASTTTTTIAATTITQIASSTITAS